MSVSDLEVCNLAFEGNLVKLKEITEEKRGLVHAKDQVGILLNISIEIKVLYLCYHSGVTRGLIGAENGVSLANEDQRAMLVNNNRLLRLASLFENVNLG
jgi:hypothetical protein